MHACHVSFRSHARHMKNRSVLQDGWEDVQGGSATPKRCDLPHGDFLKFSLFLSPFSPSLCHASLRPKQHFFVPVLTFANIYISPRMNIRWIFLDMQNYIRKVTSSRGEALARWISFLRGSVQFLLSFPITTVFFGTLVNNSAPRRLFSSGDNSGERWDAKEGYRCRGESMNGACENVHAKCSLHNLPAKVVVTLTAISLYNGYNRVECCARVA